MIFVNKLINDITELYNLISNNNLTNLSNLSNYDIPHINIYGPSGSLKKFYAYYIINKLNNCNINTSEFNICEHNILIKNNNINFKFTNHKYFKEINLYHKLSNENNILKNFIISIIQSKNILVKKHIFIIDDFDKLKYNSYMLLRRIMEVYCKDVIFIFISSNLSKIPDSIQSRCLNIKCPLLESKDLLKIVQRLTIDDNIEKKDINKLIKNNERDIYKILFNLENFIKNDVENMDIKNTNKFNKLDNYQNILNNEIVAHLNFMKKEKNPLKVLPKNREFIFKLINLNFNNQIILENFLNIIIKKYHKYLSLKDVIELTSKIEHDILNATREIYHYESYLLKIYKMFHNISLINENTKKLSGLNFI